MRLPHKQQTGRKGEVRCAGSIPPSRTRTNTRRLGLRRASSARVGDKGLNGAKLERARHARAPARLRIADTVGEGLQRLQGAGAVDARILCSAKSADGRTLNKVPYGLVATNQTNQASV
jgi:hypothetical protein